MGENSFDPMKRPILALFKMDASELSNVIKKKPGTPKNPRFPSRSYQIWQGKDRQRASMMQHSRYIGLDRIGRDGGVLPRELVRETY